MLQKLGALQQRHLERFVTEAKSLLKILCLASSPPQLKRVEITMRIAERKDYPALRKDPSDE